MLFSSTLVTKKAKATTKKEEKRNIWGYSYFFKEKYHLNFFHDSNPRLCLFVFVYTLPNNLEKTFIKNNRGLRHHCSNAQWRGNLRESETSAFRTFAPKYSNIAIFLNLSLLLVYELLMSERRRLFG